MNDRIALSTTDDAASIGSGNGRAEIELTRALVERLRAAGRRSTAELLHELRQAFPHAPLSARIAALKALRSL